MTQQNDTNPNLPTYRPKGMSKWDKIMMWTLIFIVVLFALGEGAKLIPDNNAKALPHPTPTVTKTVAPKATGPRIYVVVNSANGYLWWLDNSGGKFTASTAAQFAKGHKTFHVYYLNAG